MSRKCFLCYPQLIKKQEKKMLSYLHEREFPGFHEWLHTVGPLISKYKKEVDDQIEASQK